MPERLRGKGDDDRHADQRRERIGKAPGDEQQGAQLQQVEPEHREGRNRLQPVGRREAHGEQEIGRRQGADQHRAGEERQREIEPESHDQHGRALPGDGEPAQPHQCL